MIHELAERQREDTIADAVSARLGRPPWVTQLDLALGAYLVTAEEGVGVVGHQLLSEGARDAVEKMAEVQLPSTRSLPETDWHEFVTDFPRQFEACADLGGFSAIGRLLAERKNTATAYAEGLGDELKRPIAAVSERVRRPGR